MKMMSMARLSRKSGSVEVVSERSGGPRWGHLVRCVDRREEQRQRRGNVPRSDPLGLAMGREVPWRLLPPRRQVLYAIQGPPSACHPPHGSRRPSRRAAYHAQSCRLVGQAPKSARGFRLDAVSVLPPSSTSKRGSRPALLREPAPSLWRWFGAASRALAPRDFSF